MKKLLFIEDDRMVGGMYQCSLQSDGFQVDLAEDGEAGMARLNRAKPDLVVLDLMLPRINGVQILRHIRSQPETASLPVIVLTNAYLGQMVDEARQAGANACLIKAETNPRALVEAVRKALGVPNSSGFNAPAGRKPAVPDSPLHSRTIGPMNSPQSFWENAPKVMAMLKGLGMELFRIEENTTRVLLLFQLYQKVHLLAGAAGSAGAKLVEQMAAVFEALLKELDEHPNKINPSTLRTVAQSIDFLADLLGHRETAASSVRFDAMKVLVVDDDILTLQAVTHSLDKAALKPDCLEDPREACQLLGSRTYDLVIIDVHMPGMDGFELCKRLRTLPGNKHTPVIFLTRLSGFENRLKSAMSGGNDFIAKPFTFVELTVKAVTQLLRSHIAHHSAKDPTFKAMG